MYQISGRFASGAPALVAKSGDMVQYALKENATMTIPYTYWPAEEGGFIGYWNDYPDYLTEGETLQDLECMLRDLRNGINVMVAEGEIPAAAPCSSGVMELA